MEKQKSYFQHETAIVSSKASIGEGSRIWAFVNIQEGAQIGCHCQICDGCFIEKGAIVGNHVTLKNNVAVFDGIILEDDVFVGAQTTFINDRYPRSHREDSWVLEKILVKKGATIGANATVLCGVTIGEYAMVGAGSVVTKNVPAHAVVAGNPARIKGYICRCGKTLDENLHCVCGRNFIKEGEALRLEE